MPLITTEKRVDATAPLYRSPHFTTAVTPRHRQIALVIESSTIQSNYPLQHQKLLLLEVIMLQKHENVISMTTLSRQATQHNLGDHVALGGVVVL